MLVRTATPPSECYIPSSLTRSVQILIVIVAVGVLTVINSRLLVEHVFVFDVLVQVAEIAHMLSDLGLGILQVQRLFDPRQIL